MQCKELMTKNPVFCLPTDTADKVAQVMKEANVGAVPVVQDPYIRKLVGIITDRDVALRVGAAGLEPDLIPAAEIMIRDVAVCLEGDECQRAVETMELSQVRRVPVVDSDGRLVGIIAQADVARCLEDSEKVAHMLREISRPAGIANHSWRAGVKYCKRGALAVASMAAGASLMYLFDPARGKSRRRRLVERAQSTAHHAGKFMEGIKRNIINRTRGIAAETKFALQNEPVSDEKLVSRIRAKLGHLTSHPHAIEVSVQSGRVTLRGPILTTEVHGLLRALAKIPGVTNVENQLEMHETPAGVPLLQVGSAVKPKRVSWRPFLQLLGSIGLVLLAQAIEEKKRTTGRSRAKPAEAHSKSEAA